MAGSAGGEGHSPRAARACRRATSPATPARRSAALACPGQNLTDPGGKGPDSAASAASALSSAAPPAAACRRRRRHRRNAAAASTAAPATATGTATAAAGTPPPLLLPPGQASSSTGSGVRHSMSAEEQRVNWAPSGTAVHSSGLPGDTTTSRSEGSCSQEAGTVPVRSLSVSTLQHPAGWWERADEGR